MSLIKSFWIMIVICLVTTMIVAGFIAGKLTNAEDLALAIKNDTVPSINKAHELKLAVVQVQQWLTDISATRGQDGLNDGKDVAAQFAALAIKRIQELSQLDPEHATEYQAIVPIFDEYYRVGKMMADAYVEGGPAKGNQIMAHFDEAAEAINLKVDQLLQRHQKATVATVDQQFNILNQIWYSALMGFVLIIVAILLLFIKTWWSLKHLPNALHSISRILSGDLTSRVNAETKDEIGDLLNMVEGVRRYLLHMIGEIKTTTLQLTVTGDMVNDAVAETYSYIDEQRQTSENVEVQIASIHQMNRHITGKADEPKNISSQLNMQAKLLTDLVGRFEI